MHGRRCVVHDVIDFEASGLGSRSFPIEVGVVLGDGSRYEALIAPVPDWCDWDVDAEVMHGIDRVTLHSQGLPVSTVCKELNRLCRGRTVYSDCWVYDHAWFTKLFAAAGITPAFRCSPIEALLRDDAMAAWSFRKAAVASRWRSSSIAP